jgi:hypothetical protein
VSDHRIEPEDLGDLRELRPGDPRLEALESQPRARAQMRAYRDFVTPGDAPEGAKVTEAEARLREALERELGVPLPGAPVAPVGGSSVPSGADQPSDTRDRAGAPPRGGGLLGALFSPRMRPALAMAALVIVAGGAWLMTAGRREGEEPIMRGSAPAGPQGGISVMPSERQPGGALRLEWAPSAEADRYAVVFQAPDLTEIARVDDLSSTHLDLDPGALPAGLQSGQSLLWHVIALRGRDEVARSATQPITVP